MRRGAAKAWSARLAVVVAVGWPRGVAEADPAGDPSVRLTWDAPEGCPTRAEILAGVARVVGVGPSADQNRDPLDAMARVVVDGAAWRADVTVTRGESSSRHVEGRSCREVSDALVLIIALAIHSDTAGPPPSPVSPPPPAAAPPPPAPPAAPTPLRTVEAPRTEERPVRRSPWALGAAFELDRGSLPSLALGAGLGVSLRVSRVELAVKAALLGTGSAYLGVSQVEGATFLLFGASAGACVMVLDTSRWSVGPCVSVGPEWIFARGFGSKTPSNATASLGTATFGLDATGRLTSRFGLRVSFDAVVPFTRPDFFIEEAGGTPGVVFHLPVVAARASIGPEVHF
jgi:hypothetical protein